MLQGDNHRRLMAKPHPPAPYLRQCTVRGPGRIPEGDNHRRLMAKVRSCPSHSGGGGCLPQPRWAVCATGAGGRPAVRGKRTYGGRPGQRVEEQGTWASRTQKHSQAGDGRPVDRGAWAAKTVKRPRQQPAHPHYANYWAPLTCKRHIPPHSAQPQHTNDWAPRTRKRHQQEHRPQRPTECSDPTQHAKAIAGDCPEPRKGTTTRRNVTQGAGLKAQL